MDLIYSDSIGVQRPTRGEDKLMNALPATRLRSGITLVELMMASACGGLLMLTLAPMVVRTHQQFWRTSAQAIVSRDERDVLRLISMEVNNANGPTVVLSQHPGEAPYSKISFTTTDGANISFWRSGSTLLYRKNGVERVVTNNVRTLVFLMPWDSPNIYGVQTVLRLSAQSGPARVARESASHMFFAVPNIYVPLGG